MLTFSSSPIPSPFVYPKNLKTEDLIGIDVGPELLSTPQEELPSRVWEAEYVEGVGVEIGPTGGTRQLLFNETDVSFVDLTFDTSNNPLVAYQKNGRVYIYWYDPLSATFTSTELSIGARPSCILDKRYPSQTTNVILAYQLGTFVKYRLSSERFTVERDSTLINVASFQGAYMGTGNRIVFKAILY